MTTPTTCEPPPSLEGYWYDSLDPKTPLERIADRVRRDIAAPPWIVVDRTIPSIITSRWPGRLWRVRVIELGDMSNLGANPPYWRAREIELLEALPLALLFGLHGQAVMALQAQVPTITLEQAEALTATLHPEADAAYGRAWEAWLDPDDHLRGTGVDWSCTVAVGGRRGRSPSPIHSGFILIAELLGNRARAVSGDQAVVRIEVDGEIEEGLAPAWAGARSALLHAAMAKGAPEQVEPTELAVLTQAYESVFGPA